MASEGAVLEWTRHLNESGLCIIRGVPLAQGEVARLGARISPATSTLYATVWDVRNKKDPINVAYTTEGLEPHMDLAYYESPPGIQLLHCMAFGEMVTGGDSIFYDTFVLAELLRERNPAAFEVLARVPATFQTDHMERDHPAQFFYTRPHIALSGVDHRGLPMVSVSTASLWSSADSGLDLMKRCWIHAGCVLVPAVRGDVASGGRGCSPLLRSIRRVCRFDERPRGGEGLARQFASPAGRLCDL